MHFSSASLHRIAFSDYQKRRQQRFENPGVRDTRPAVAPHQWQWGLWSGDSSSDGRRSLIRMALDVGTWWTKDHQLFPDSLSSSSSTHVCVYMYILSIHAYARRSTGARARANTIYYDIYNYIVPYRRGAQILYMYIQHYNYVLLVKRKIILPVGSYIHICAHYTRPTGWMERKRGGVPGMQSLLSIRADVRLLDLRIWCT